jgi:hypothetical protein
MKNFTIKPYVYPEEGSNDNWIIRLKVFTFRGEEIKKREQFFSGYSNREEAMNDLQKKIDRLTLEVKHNSMTSQEAEEGFRKMKQSLNHESISFKEFFKLRNTL